MKVAEFILPVALGLLFANPGASAPGTVRISWERCDSYVQHRCFAAAMTPLVVSVQGTSEPHRGNRIILLIQQGVMQDLCIPECSPDPDLADAWRFDAAGCNAGQFAVTATAPGCPAFQGTNPLTIFHYGFDPAARSWATFDVLSAYDTVANPDPDLWHTLYQITFDHSASTCGDADPSIACGNADVPAQFRVLGSEFLRPDRSITQFDLGNDWVSWQDSGCEPNCPVVQTQSSTWGRIKGLYR